MSVFTLEEERELERKLEQERLEIEKRHKQEIYKELHPLEAALAKHNQTNNSNNNNDNNNDLFVSKKPKLQSQISENDNSNDIFASNISQKKQQQKQHVFQTTSINKPHTPIRQRSTETIMQNEAQIQHNAHMEQNVCQKSTKKKFTKFLFCCCMLFFEQKLRYNGMMFTCFTVCVCVCVCACFVLT